jgi:hypothetical protein
MKLHIPEQQAPAKGAIPNHPRKLKKWLAALPHANMGEMTRQIYSAVRELNRQTIPTKYRIEDLELLREYVRNIFDHLEKYFINRTLPLPEKSQKIVNLNQSLLQEMSFGYKIIVNEAANGTDRKVDTKTQNIAILRAIRYMSELLLRASEIYQPYPAGSWYDIHQMYSYAEQLGINKKVITDTEYEYKKASIEDYYKQVMLFALARPTALRQSDTERVYKKLAEWSKLTKLGRDAQENQVNRFFCARTDQDRPPSYLSMQDCDDTSMIRTLETTKLVDTIRKNIESAQNAQDKLAVGDQFSIETMQVVAMSWGVCAKRRFSRADRSGNIKAAIGLVNAAREISGRSQAEETEVNIKPGKRNQLNISLEAVSEDFETTQSQVSTRYTTPQETGSDTEEAWDMVAKGRVLTETYDRQKKLLDDNSLRQYKNFDSDWEIVNVSAGGYCLRWNSDIPSRAQIGELIALREKEPDGSFAWRVGVIRWMQFTRENGLEIGVQVLSPKVMSATAQRIHRPNEEPFDCLMLPGIKPLNLPPSVLLPAHAFKPGDTLKIRIAREETREKTTNNTEETDDIRLVSISEHTGSFTQFEFVSKDAVEKAEKEEKKKAADKNKDNFDEIWSSL